MNILFCYNKPISTKQGGVAAVSKTLIQGFTKHGHVCYAVSALNIENDDINNQYYLPISTTNVDNSENRQWFQQFVKEKQIDIVINQNALQPSIPEWAIFWSKGFPVKIITVYHNCLFPMFSCKNKRLNSNIIVKTFHLKPVLDTLWHHLFRLKYRRKFRRSIKLSDKVVMLSQKYFPELSWFSGLNINDHFQSIANPALDRFNVDISELQKEREILYVGRLEPQKRIDYLLEVWKKVVMLHKDWHLTIVGDGTLKQALMLQVEAERIDKVSFEGFKDPLEYYKRASIFCMTSEFEGFPGVLTESMSCGCVPIIFNSYACASDIVEDERNGFLVTPFDINIFAQKLERLMDNNGKLVEMAYAAKEKSLNYTLDNIINQWETIFK